ncbi:hypothetical protein DN752_13580 [Echinicola strongylocentroti]|uniref:DUF4270 domain-containing protein n=1 Tax=Echinicola strongylocentroti TaxID=1795355 RepID=A0A2Z4IS98_9BACT|nr:hypothetical protein DN752_13580 [Echinicola strongylocentroti]
MLTTKTKKNNFSKVITTSIQNWQAKLAGLLLLSTPLIYGCEDPSDIGLVLDPEANRIGVFYAEIPLSAYLVSADSLNTTNSGTLVAGGDISDYFGRTEATAYSRLTFSTSATIPESEAILDSAKFSLGIGSLTAEDLDEAKTFSAYKLTEPILDTAYYNFDHLAYEEAPFAAGSFMLKENSDTVVFMNLEEALADDLFTKLKGEDPVFNDIFSFRDYFPGFALKGSPEQQTTINVIREEHNTGYTNTGIKLYYRNSEEDTVSSVYSIYTNGVRHFNSITNDPSGTPTSIVTEKNTAYDVGDLVGSKALLGHMVKLNMEPLSNFLDTLGNVIFNKASLEMGPTENFPDSNMPIQGMIQYLADDNNEILRREDGAPYSVQQKGYPQTTTDDDGNVVPVFTSGGANPLAFNTEKFIYTPADSRYGITDYVDALYRTDVVRTDLLLYPASITYSGNSIVASNSLTRSLREYIVNQNSITLKIYYTKLR